MPMPTQSSQSSDMMQVYLYASMIVMLGNACAYLFQLLAARGLSTADFGAVSALLNLSFFMMAPFSGASLAISKLLIDHGTSLLRMKGFVRRIVIAGILVAVVLFGVFWSLSGFVAERLHLDRLTADFLFPALVASTFLCLVPIGIWQAERAHFAMSVGVASIPVLRLAGMALFVTWLGGHLTGAMLALVLSCAGMVAASFWSESHYWQGQAEAPPRGVYRELLVFAGPASLGSFSLMAITYMDVPLVRALATPEQSGLYAAAATLSKIVLLLPSALVNIVFPEAATLTRQGGGHRQSRRLILLALMFTLASSGVAALIMVIAPAFCFELLGGGGYRNAAGMLQYLAPAMSCMAVVSLLVTYAMACNRMVLVWPCLTAIIGVPLVAFSQSMDPDGIARLMLMCLGGLAVASLAWLAFFLVTSAKQAASDG